MRVSSAVFLLLLFFAAPLVLQGKSAATGVSQTDISTHGFSTGSRKVQIG